MALVMSTDTLRCLNDVVDLYSAPGYVLFSVIS